MQGERNNEQDGTDGAALGGAPEAHDTTASDDAREGEAREGSPSDDGTGEGPRRKRRRRRRGKKSPDQAAAADGGEARAPGPTGAAAGGGGSQGRGGEGFTSGPAPRERSRDRGSRGGGGSQDRGGSRGGEAATSAVPQAADPAWATLAAGLLSHLDDRQVPCKVDGCVNTWNWSAQEQMQAFGKPPPRRMCGEHMAQLGDLGDREVPCANPGCERTWSWPRSAQLAQVQRTGSAEPPRKVCPECTKEERELSDREVPCRVDGCARTWTWNRDAQLKHRTWARRHAEEEEAAGGPPPAERGRGGKRRRRRKQRANVHEPPPRMCLPCRDKAERIVEHEVPCKVHGCTRTTVLDRESQLRAWAKLGTLDLSAEGSQTRRMCETCREFCRTHPDREVACGRPGCDQTWTYKTGAQLQDFLAGRRQDPIRLCDECAKGGLVGQAVGAPEGMEALPCVVPLCEGVWFYREGVTEVARTGTQELPLDRMCDACRGERGAEPRAAEASAVGDEASAVAAEASDDGRPGEPEVGRAAPGLAAVSEESGQEVVSGTPVLEAGAANGAIAANQATAANEATAANDPSEAPAPDDDPGP